MQRNNQGIPGVVIILIVIVVFVMVLMCASFLLRPSHSDVPAQLTNVANNMISTQTKVSIDAIQTQTELGNQIAVTKTNFADAQTNLMATLVGNTDPNFFATATAFASTKTTFDENIGQTSTANAIVFGSTQTAISNDFERTVTSAALTQVESIENKTSQPNPSDESTKTPRVTKTPVVVFSLTVPPVVPTATRTNPTPVPTNTPLPTSTPMPTNTSPPPTNTPPPPALSFSWDVQATCNNVIEIRVHNQNAVTVQVEGSIWAQPDGGQKKTIAEVPGYDQDCGSGYWCGPIERIGNHFSNFHGTVGGVVRVYYQGKLVDSQTLGQTTLACN